MSDKTRITLTLSALYWLLILGVEFASQKAGHAGHTTAIYVTGAIVVWLSGIVLLHAQLLHSDGNTFRREFEKRFRSKGEFAPNTHIKIHAPTQQLEIETKVPFVLVETSVVSYPKNGHCRLVAVTGERLLNSRGVLHFSPWALPGMPCVVGKSYSYDRPVWNQRWTVIEITLSKVDDYRALCGLIHKRDSGRSGHTISGQQLYYPMLIPI